MLRLRDVAVQLNCSLQNVHELIRRGLLACIRVGAGGRGLRVEEAELQRFLEGRRVELPVTIPRPKFRPGKTEWF